MALTKVLVTVKTYPSLSATYGELVCTAGFLEDGTWIRLYPIPFRKLKHNEKYKKYQWVELDIVKNEKDFRPESHRPATIETPITLLDRIDTKKNWYKRKEIVLNKGVYTDIKKLIAEAHDKEICTSLAVFKPNRVTDFKVEKVSAEWDKKKLDQLKALNDQGNLFDMEELPFEVVEKLPYKFSYVLEDEKGVSSTMMIEDWEIGQLYRNTLANAEGNEAIAVEKVKEKYFNYFALKKDLYLFLGTTKAFHYRSKNPFMIIGTFTPDIETQISLF
ncbi:hypothetical protein ACWBC2_02190 [Salegentibacter agarivorans]|jgi:hypothetical protein|tara:strand:+ start:2326 stop:3150 length:825 start_codon:yes stop_codon:yes gene_type:complete